MATLLHFLPRIDNMIYTLQQELVDIAAMKAGATWREKGKRSASYLRAIHRHRTTQQYMASLQPPTTTAIATARTTTPSIRVNEQSARDIDSMKDYAHQFYQMLYTADHVEEVDIVTYLNRINFDCTLSDSDQEKLMQSITINELIDQASRVSKPSSPGADGLSYPFLALLFQLPCLKNLVVQVYNDTLQGLFPS